MTKKEGFYRHFADKLFSRRWYKTVVIGTKLQTLINSERLDATWENWMGYRASYF
ncbi:hypothetical protein ACFLTP_06860 [Chloroflexota bacterium]